MKKVVSLLLCAVMLIGLLPVSAFAADINQMTLTADKTAVAAGEEVVFSMSIDLIETTKQFGLILEFDRDIFEFVSAKYDRNFAYDEDDNDLVQTKVIDNEKGSFGVLFVPSKGENGEVIYTNNGYTGKVGTFTLKVKEGADFVTTTVTGTTSIESVSNVLEINAVELTNATPVETTAPEHVHTWTDVAAVEPTCTTDGNIAYQFCEECGAAQTAGENPMPLSKFGWILAAQHTALVHYDAIEASCGVDGHEAYDYCEDCQVFVYEDPMKLTYQDGVIPALEHAWVEHEAVEPTCDTEGNIAYKQCTNCGEAWSLGENSMPLGRYGWVLGALDHTWVDHEAVAPTCYADGNIAYQQCSVCGAAQTAGENPIPLSKDGWVLAAQHSALVHYDAIEATCDTDGHEAYDYCEDCQVFIYEDPLKLSFQDGVIPALGHTWVDHEAVAPSCNAEGNIAYQQCSVCGAAQTAGENPMPLGKFGWVLAATGEHTFEHHDAVAPTCDTEGHEAFDYCTTCECFFYEDPLKLTYQAGIILPLGHTWVDHEAVAPTCYADGNIAYQQCSVCGAAQTAGENPIPLSKDGWVLAAQHTALVHYDAIEATCDMDGHEAYDYCEACQVFVYEDPLKLSYQDGVIPATGHTLDHVEAVAPTCHSLGNVEYWYCVDCGYAWLDEEMTKVSNLKSVILPELGSEKLEHFEAVEPTCHDRGVVEYWYCPECDAYFLDEACTQLTNALSIYLPELGSEKLEHVEAKAATTEAEGNVEYWYCPECGRYFLDEACTQLTNAKNVVIAKLEAPEATKPVEKPTTTPGTGDVTPVVALVVMAVLAICGLALVMVNKKKFSV